VDEFGQFADQGWSVAWVCLLGGAWRAQTHVIVIIDSAVDLMYL